MPVTLPITPETVTRTTLDNGLVVLVKQNPHNPSVTLRGRIRAGALYDTSETAGLAEMTTAALQRGTRKRSFQQLNEELDRAGMSFGVGSGMESIGFSGKCLVEDFDRLLDIASDVLRNPTFPREEVDKLRNEIVTDLKEADQDTQRVAYREFRRLLYPSLHPYHRLSDGTVETVSKLRVPALRNYHSTYFRPDRTAIVLVGDITPEQALEKVSRAFGDWPVRGLGPAHVIPDAPAATSVMRADSPLEGKTQTDLVLGYVGLRRTDPDFYALNVGDLIFGRLGLYGRLGASVRDKQGLAYYVYSSVEANVGPGPWAIHAGVNPRNLERAIAGILDEIYRLRTQPVSADELGEAVDFMTGSLALRLETNEGVGATLSDIESFDLGLDYLERYPGIIKGITPDQIVAVVQKYALPERYVVSTAGPMQPKQVPAEQAEVARAH